MSESLVESVLKNKSSKEKKQQLIPARVVPTPVIVAASVSLAPDFREEQGILARWKAQQMDRKSALTVLDAKYAGHLEVVKHNVLKQVMVGKAQISVKAEELLKELDAKHLEIVAQLDMRNVSTRTKIMRDATDMIVAEVREVENKDWPEQLKVEVITKAFELRQQFVDRLMEGG